jgi:hypothetical protein
MRTKGKTVKKAVGTLFVSGIVALAGLGMTAGTAHAFNPQPDPPGKSSSRG